MIPNPAVESTSVEQTRRRERAERILNVAEDLLLKHGYRRITIDDIAKQSGIGKGTIYLHWKSKEELFGTILLREIVTIWKELIQRVQHDPNRVLFSEVMRSMMLIGMQRPLARAFFTADRELLGKLVESRVGPRQQADHLVGQDFFLKTLRDHGLLRSDQDLSLQSYALRATITGFLMIDPGQGEENDLSLEQRAEALAQTVRSAFEPEQLPPKEKLFQVAGEMGRWLEKLIAVFEAKIQEPMK
jgi:AcrR family transcriptional regulator